MHSLLFLLKKSQSSLTCLSCKRRNLRNCTEQPEGIKEGKKEKTSIAEYFSYSPSIKTKSFKHVHFAIFEQQFTERNENIKEQNNKLVPRP